MSHELFGLGVLLVAAAPIAWFASEFQDRRWLRLTLGTIAILLSFAVAFLVGMAERFNSNAWFGAASATLIQATIEEMEAGREERVLRAFKELQQSYRPTYENRGRYDVLVEAAVARMQSGP